MKWLRGRLVNLAVLALYRFVALGKSRRNAIAAAIRSAELLNQGKRLSDDEFSWAKFAIACDRTYPGGYIALARAYSADGRIQEAEDSVKLGIAACGETLELLAELADIYRLQVKHEEADEIYQMLHQKYPENSDILLRVIGILIRKGEFEDARFLIEDIPQDLRGISKFFRAIISVLINCGEISDAQLMIKRYLDQCPDDAYVHYAESMIYASHGDILAAHNALDRAIDLEPDNEQFQRAREEIATMAAEVALRNVRVSSPSTHKYSSTDTT